MNSKRTRYLGTAFLIATITLCATGVMAGSNFEGDIESTKVFGWTGSQGSGRESGYGETIVKRPGDHVLITIPYGTADRVSPAMASMMLDMLSTEGRTVEFISVEPYPHIGQRNQYWDAFYVDTGSVLVVKGLSETTVQNSCAGSGVLDNIRLYTNSEDYGAIQIKTKSGKMHTIHLQKSASSSRSPLPESFAQRIIAVMSKKWSSVNLTSTGCAGNTSYFTKYDTIETRR